MPNVNTGIALNQNLLTALDQWAVAEYRSRNNLIQLLLTQAVQRRQTTLSEASTPDAEAPSSQRTVNVTIPAEDRLY